MESTFKELFLESKKFYITDKDGNYLTVKGKKISFTDNKEMAYTFKSEKEANQWEDDNANNFDELTYVVNEDLSPAKTKSKHKKITTVRSKMKTEFFKELMRFVPTTEGAAKESDSGVYYNLDTPKGKPLEYRFSMKTEGAKYRQLLIQPDGSMMISHAERGYNFNKKAVGQLDKKIMPATRADLKNFGKYIELLGGYNPSADIIRWIQENVTLLTPRQAQKRAQEKKSAAGPVDYTNENQEEIERRVQRITGESRMYLDDHFMARSKTYYLVFGSKKSYAADSWDSSRRQIKSYIESMYPNYNVTVPEAPYENEYEWSVSVGLKK